MSYTFFKQHIRVLALVTMCIITPLAFAQQPPPPCHITITGDFESQCILPRDKDSYCNEEEDEVIACQGNKVIYTANANTGGVAVTQRTWSVAGASTWTDNLDGTVTVTWGTGTMGQITVDITTASDYSCSQTLNVRLIEKPDIYVTTTPAYVIMPNGTKVINVCSGETVEFSDLSSTTNTDIVGYYWESDFYNLTASTPTFKIENVWHNDEVIHRVYNNCGCYDEEHYYINVLQGESLNLGCYGTVCQNAIVHYTANNPVCNQYSWYVEGGSIVSGQNQPTVTVQWDHPQNGYGIIGLDGSLCGGTACPSMLSKKIPIIEDSITIKGQNVVCVDEAVIYSVPLYGSTMYNWDIQPSTGIAVHEVNGANQKMIEFQQQGTYQIKVSYRCDFLECGMFFSKPLTVEVKPKLSITGEERICISNACDLKTDPNVSASWEVLDVDNNYQSIHMEAGNTFAWIFPHPGKYQIVAEHPDYCRPAVFVITVVDVPPAPTIDDIDPNNPGVACLNSSILLKANPTNPDYTIVWMPSCDEGTPQSVPGNEVTISYSSAVCDVHAYNYDRVLNCLSANYYIHQVVEFQLEPHGLPSSITVCPGAVLNWSVPLQDMVIYEWQLQPNAQYCASVQGDIFSNSISLLINELTLPNAYPAQFTITLTRTYCSNQKETHTVTVNVYDNLSQNLSISPVSPLCVDNNAILTGSGCSGLQWNIQGDNQTYTDNPLDYTFTQPGNIQVTLSCNPYDFCNNDEYIAQQSIIVNVNPQPPVIRLEWDGTNVYTVPPLGFGYDFAWSHTSANSWSVPTVPNVNSYTCTITSQTAPYCFVTKSVTIGSAPPSTPCNNLPITFSGINYCDKTISFLVSNPSGMVNWFVSGGSHGTPVYSGSYNEVITIPVYDVTSYIVSASIVGTPCYTGTTSYLVDFLPDFYFEKACDAIIIHNNSKYLNSNKQLILSVNGTPLPSITTSTSTQTFNSGSGGFFTFRLTSYDGNNINCFLESVTINNTEGVLSLSAANTTTCDNTAILLTSTPAMNDIYWDFDDNSAITSATNTIYHTFEYGGPYTITATAYNSDGCSLSGALTINSYLNTLKPEELSPQNNINVCPGTNRTIQYTVNEIIPPHPRVEYQWSTPITPSLNDENYHETYYTGDYDVVVTNQNYCKAKAMVNVPFLNAPTAVIVSPSSVYCVGETIELYGAPDPDTSNYTFTWSITDSITGVPQVYSDANISFTPTHAGAYRVKLCVKLDSTGCEDCTTETIRVNPTPPPPAVAFGTNKCIDNPPVFLTGTSSVTNIINWSNGDIGPNAYYFMPGVATAWYYDPNTGCRSEDTNIYIEPEPDFDALLTGCYEKCTLYFETNPRLPVWGLSSGRGRIDWDWLYNGSSYTSGSIVPDYFLSLPLPGFGKYQLLLDYNNGNCHVESPILRINPKDTCDCEDLSVTYKYSWYVHDCRVYYKIEAVVCNTSTSSACLSSLKYLFDLNYFKIVTNNFTSQTLAPNDCYSFHMTIEALQFLPSTTISFRLYDSCNDCFTNFSIDLAPENLDCNTAMVLDRLVVNSSLSSSVAGYFNFAMNVNPAQTVLAFWSDPPMVINYLFNGIDLVNGPGMIDMSLLSQLVAQNGSICFYAITCSENRLCKRKYCIPAQDLYDMIQETLNPPDPEPGEGKTDGTSTFNSLTPQLMPNPTTGEVNVIGTTDKVIEVLVMDMNGRERAIFENSSTFNISTLTTGAYIVRIKTRRDNETHNASPRTPQELVSYLKLVKK